MSDATLNRFLAYGTDAQRLAFTPAPPTPASGPSPVYAWFTTDTLHLWVYTNTWIDLGSLSGAFALTGVISPAALGADQNDYAPTGFSTASVLRLSASIATVNITGLAGGASGLLKLVMNVGASNNLVLKNESASSLAANRFDATGDVTLAPSAWTLIWYDSTSSRWRVLVTGGGGGSGTVTSVGVSSSDSLITVGSTPVTTAGTITLAMAMPITPQGRLTLTSGVPVMNADATAQGTIFYTPYIGGMVPLYDGTEWTIKSFSQVSLTLNATDNVSGSLYDIFLFNNSGTLTLGTGPAWTSTTARGTGAGTTEIHQLNGLWTNANAITLRAGGVSLGSIAVNQALYLGTAYMTANGQTGMAFAPAAAAGGTNNFLGLYNAYNRVAFRSISRDNTASWTETSATWHNLNGSASNRISYVDGLQQSSPQFTISTGGFTPTTATGMAISVDLDSSTAEPPNAISVTSVNTAVAVTVVVNYGPSLGLHYGQAVSIRSFGSGTGTFLGLDNSRQLQATQCRVEM